MLNLFPLKYWLSNSFQYGPEYFIMMTRIKSFVHKKGNKLDPIAPIEQENYTENKQCYDQVSVEFYRIEQITG